MLTLNFLLSQPLISKTMKTKFSLLIVCGIFLNLQAQNKYCLKPQKQKWQAMPIGLLTQIYTT